TPQETVKPTKKNKKPIDKEAEKVVQASTSSDISKKVEAPLKRGRALVLGKKIGSCTLPGQLSMDNHICLIGGQIFYFIVHVFFQLSTCISNCPEQIDQVEHVRVIVRQNLMRNTADLITENENVSETINKVLVLHNQPETVIIVHHVCHQTKTYLNQTSFKVNGIEYVQRACESLAICEEYKMNPNFDLAITGNGIVTDVETSCCSEDLCNSEENINSVQRCYYCAYCSPLDRTTVPCGSNSDSCRQTSFMSNGVSFVQRSCETTAQCELYKAFPQSVLTKLGASGGVASNIVTSCCTENLFTNRLFELSERYVRVVLSHSILLVVRLVEEYTEGFESRYIEYPTPLCNCYLVISSFIPDF
ncbi:hypothetical protein BpHYR1_043440, partial [Brachionus plicatilis]